MSPQEAFGIFLVLIGCAAPIIIIGLVYYLKKRLEHKQIMAAIEKGTPLSELKPPKQNGRLWIRNLTMGIAMLIVGIGWSFAIPHGGPSTLIALVLVGLGIAWIIRGMLNRKYQPQIQPSATNNTTENRIPHSVSAAETLKQPNE